LAWFGSWPKFANHRILVGRFPEKSSGKSLEVPVVFFLKKGFFSRAACLIFPPFPTAVVKIQLPSPTSFGNSVPMPWAILLWGVYPNMLTSWLLGRARANLRANTSQVTQVWCYVPEFWTHILPSCIPVKHVMNLITTVLFRVQPILYLSVDLMDCHWF
jgi:hypothetical protein